MSEVLVSRNVERIWACDVAGDTVQLIFDTSQGATMYFGMGLDGLQSSTDDEPEKLYKIVIANKSKTYTLNIMPVGDNVANPYLAFPASASDGIPIAPEEKWVLYSTMAVRWTCCNETGGATTIPVIAIAFA